MTRTVGDEVVFIDARYSHLLNEYDWKVKTINGYQYLVAPYRGEEVFLHRLIMKPKSRKHVRFSNGDGLDCRRKNLKVI